MSRVYSTQFYDDNVGVGVFSMFEVPEGYTYVLRSIDCMNGQGDGPVVVDPFVVRASYGAPFWGSGMWTPLSYIPYSWRGRQVMTAGDQLFFVTETAEWYVWASGYALQLP